MCTPLTGAQSALTPSLARPPWAPAVYSIGAIFIRIIPRENWGFVALSSDWIKNKTFVDKGAQSLDREMKDSEVNTEKEIEREHRVGGRYRLFSRKTQITGSETS